MPTFKDWLVSAKNFVLYHWVWAAAIGAVTALLLSPKIGDVSFRAAVQSASTVILASGIAGAVIRSSTFTEMFIARIVDVFYESKHLKSRNDLAQICTRTLNALLEAESPSLRGVVGNELLTSYLDFKLGFIYKDFSSEIEVLDFDSSTKIMTILETTRAVIIPSAGKSEIDLTWSWISQGSAHASAQLVSLSVAGNEIPPQLRMPTVVNGLLKVSYKHKFPPCTSSDEEASPFELVRRVKKKVDLAYDPVTAYRFVVPTINMSITLVTFPDTQLSCELLPLGLPRDFVPDRLPTQPFGHWRNQKYTGLIFPRQGAILQWYIK